MTQEYKILVVDDDKSLLNSISGVLSVRDYEVDLAGGGEEGLSKVKQTNYDLALVDLKMEGMDGLELTKAIKQISPETIVIIITAQSSIESAIAATKLGAYDYLPKPFTMEELIFRVEHGLAERGREKELVCLREQIQTQYSFDNIISKDSKMQAIFNQILQVAESDATVIIFGETGTGKELIAKSIHYHSKRKNNPFIAVHCAALSETILASELFGHEKGSFTGAFKQKKGRFEQADGGSIFLDEVGDIPVATQVKLLRVLQQREFERVGGTDTLKTDIRIISATNKDLSLLAKKDKFREDLYYRLNVFPISLPPLRERKGDIPILVSHFLEQLNQRFGKEIEKVSETVLEQLYQHNWPGNIRELENVLERAVLVSNSPIIDHVDLTHALVKETPDFIDRIEDLKEFNKKVIFPAERDFFIRMIKKHNSNVDDIIKFMGIGKTTFYNRLKEYDINLQDY